jgi:hypothetical protein
VAWTPEGLYVAALANTYVDPNFLAYEDEFPASEAFQLHVVVDVQGRLHHFVVYLVPYTDPRLPDGFGLMPRLYRSAHGKPARPLPVQGRVQRLNRNLPHIALEAFFPADWIGIKQLAPNMTLKMNIGLTNYYNEHAMVWSGPPSLKDMEAPGSLKTVLLKDK